MRIAQVGVFAVWVGEDTDTRGIGCVARSARGEQVVLAVADEVRGSLAGIGNVLVGKVDAVLVGHTQEVVGELGTDEFAVGTLEPDIALARLGVAPHVEVAHAEAFGLQALHILIRTPEVVGLHDDEVAVGVHRLNPAYPLRGARIVEDVGTVEGLRIVQRRGGVDGVRRDNEPHVLPVVEVGRAVGTDTPRPHVAAQRGERFVLAIPVVDAVVTEHLKAVGLNGLAIGVEPYLAWADAVVGGVITCLLTAGDEGDKGWR